ncbi:MAG: methyltransferase domain-containing protein [Spirochaetales bacterium]|nr:methyltransferase domain-containing protein [Spirochaetales bacterium]
MACPFCTSARSALVHTASSPTGLGAVCYYRCRSCASIYQHPLPSPEGLCAYYERYLDVKARMNPGYLDPASVLSVRRERSLTFREIGFDPGRIACGTNAELGCANGLFLRYLVEEGSLRTIGLDLSESLLSAIVLSGVRILHGGLELLDEKSVDNLYLFNVAEHALDIEALFYQASRVLAQEGCVVLELPLSGLVSRFFGQKWRFLMPDEHLAIPSMKGLRILLRKTGFTIRGQTRFGSGWTSGSIYRPIKRLCDFAAKHLGFGDRGCFLLEYRNPVAPRFFGLIQGCVRTKK